MATAEFLGQTVLDVAIAPGRVAYLIADGSRDGFRRAVQEASTRWGGQIEPIVPVAVGGAIVDWWRQVVALAGVEVAINVNVPQVDAAAAAAALDLSLISLADIDGPLAASAFTMHPAHVEADRVINGPYLFAERDAPLWQVAVAGDLTDDHIAALNLSRAPRGPRSFPIQRVRADDQLARAQLRGSTLLDRTISYVGEWWASGGPSRFPALIWVTRDDDIDDCLWFWNLRALRPLRLETVPMVLLPLGGVENWVGYANELAPTLKRLEGFSPDVILGSRSVDEQQLAGVANHLGLHRSTEGVRSGRQHPALLREAPYTYLTDTELTYTGVDYRRWLTFPRRYGEPIRVLAQLFRDETVVRFVSPVPFTEPGYAMLRLSGGPFGALPRRAAAARLVKNGATWHGDMLQFATQATRDYDVRIRVPRMLEIVDAVLGEAVESYRLSDKGKIGAALQASRDIGVLLQQGAFEAISELTTPRAVQLRRELRKLHDEGVEIDQASVERLVTDWGHRGERRYRPSSQISKIGRPALETLTEQGWAERGFEIVCSNCGVSTFVPMAEVTTRGPAICGGCGSPQRYTAINHAPTVNYRLDGLVDRASDQGVLPHLLLIAALTAQEADCTLLPGADLVFPDGHTPEVDIFGVFGARMIAGEVKTKASDFDDGQLTRDVALSKRLRVDVHVLAALDAVSPEIEAAARERCGKAGLQLAVFDVRQLRPGREDSSTE